MILDGLIYLLAALVVTNPTPGLPPVACQPAPCVNSAVKICGKTLPGAPSNDVVCYHEDECGQVWWEVCGTRPSPDP